MAKLQLQKKAIEYKEININDSEENIKLAEKYNVQNGGTLVDDTTSEIININSL
jgi:hypothetical protein